MEEWRDIKGYEGMYQVSNLGRVKSLARYRKIKENHYQPIKEKIMKPFTAHNGYLRIALSKNGEKEKYMVHRLVAYAFMDKPEGKDEVNHIDGDKGNNRIENLEWVTSSENQIHAHTIGLQVHPKGEESSKYNTGRKIICVETGEVFANTLRANEKYGVDPSSLAKCCKGIYKTCGGYHWRYAEPEDDYAFYTGEEI